MPRWLCTFGCLFALKLSAANLKSNTNDKPHKNSNKIKNSSRATFCSELRVSGAADLERNRSRSLLTSRARIGAALHALSRASQPRAGPLLARPAELVGPPKRRYTTGGTATEPGSIVAKNVVFWGGSCLNPYAHSRAELSKPHMSRLSGAALVLPVWARDTHNALLPQARAEATSPSLPAPKH